MTADNTNAKRVAPWPDYAGNVIHEGDLIKHPVSGQLGLVKYCEDQENDKWRVIYGDGFLSHLCLQISDKGQAVVCNELSSESIELLIKQLKAGIRLSIDTENKFVAEILPVPVREHI